jgi:hypothetical protein
MEQLTINGQTEITDIEAATEALETAKHRIVIAMQRVKDTNEAVRKMRPQWEATQSAANSASCEYANARNALVKLLGAYEKQYSEPRKFNES